jgi:hypothetical protein
VILFLPVAAAIALLSVVVARSAREWAWFNEPKWPVMGVLLVGAALVWAAWMVINPGASPGPVSPPQLAASAGQAPRELVEVPAWASMEPRAGPPAPASVPVRKQAPQQRSEAAPGVNTQARTLVGLVQQRRWRERQGHKAHVRAKRHHHQRLHRLRKHALYFWGGYCYWWSMRHDACSKPRHAIRHVTSVTGLRWSVRHWRHRRSHVKAHVKAWLNRQAARRAARHRVAPPVYSAPVAPPPVLVAAPKPRHRAAPVAPYTPPVPVATAAPAPPPSSGGVSAPSPGGVQAPAKQRKPPRPNFHLGG